MHMVDAKARSAPKDLLAGNRFGLLEVTVWRTGLIPTVPPTGAEEISRAAVHSHALDPTTSFLTAAALIYAIGAGITAGAGTRLVHQLILTDRFRYRPWQSSHGRAA